RSTAARAPAAASSSASARHDSTIKNPCPAGVFVFAAIRLTSPLRGLKLTAGDSDEDRRHSPVSLCGTVQTLHLAPFRWAQVSRCAPRVSRLLAREADCNRLYGRTLARR